jgi:hypothetical protein
MSTNGRDNAGPPSGALTRRQELDADRPLDTLLSWFRFVSVSSFVTKPHAARSRGSAAPVDVATTTSASRIARVAAMLLA